eukprot:TRINITY_DN9185_c0_g1_i3.p1 TRINITY_DN9185_c0_g1~~TRINITY_DN9185_c0_g1_i3.p1  ORF type:complete len:959 (-),score=240.93 TRINITY_DN9185_c0_g1_i3:531-3407(-)
MQDNFMDDDDDIEEVDRSVLQGALGFVPHEQEADEDDNHHHHDHDADMHAMHLSLSPTPSHHTLYAYHHHHHHHAPPHQGSVSHLASVVVPDLHMAPTPTPMADLLAALTLNREYQAVLREQIRQVELAQVNNVELQSKIKAHLVHANKATSGRNKSSSSSSSSSTSSSSSSSTPSSSVVNMPASSSSSSSSSSTSLGSSSNIPINSDVQQAGGLSVGSSVAPRITPGTRYFADLDGNTPPENTDAVRKRDHISAVPTFTKFKKWTKEEIAHLAAGVRSMNLKQRYAEVQRRYAEADPDMLEEYNREVEAIKQLSAKELETATEGMDWDALARLHVKSRSGADCKIQWLNIDLPSLNKQAFNKDEDKKLIALAHKYRGHSWENIAQELGSGRSAVQCFRRYQRSLNANMMKSGWTQEDDDKLRDAVRKHGEKNWQQVANHLEGRTGQQCLHRWQKTLNPAIRRGRWSSAEDELLKAAVKHYGPKSWIKICQHVPGRTDVQCRERWVNVLCPDVNKGAWTPEEDSKLDEVAARHPPGAWADVAAEMGSRTDNQCWRRWKYIHRGEQVEEYKKSVQKRKKGLPANFVGREKERSDITAADFDDTLMAPVLEDAVRQPRRRRTTAIAAPIPTPIMPAPVPVPMTVPMTLPMTPMPIPMTSPIPMPIPIPMPMPQGAIPVLQSGYLPNIQPGPLSLDHVHAHGHLVGAASPYETIPSLSSHPLPIPHPHTHTHTHTHTHAHPYHTHHSHSLPLYSDAYHTIPHQDHHHEVPEDSSHTHTHTHIHSDSSLPPAPAPAPTDTTSIPHLPLVYPSPPIYRALYRLVSSLAPYWGQPNASTSSSSSSSTTTTSEPPSNDDDSFLETSPLSSASASGIPLALPHPSTTSSSSSSSSSSAMVPYPGVPAQTFPSTNVFDYVDSPDFQVLSLWFYSLFLLPLHKVMHETGYIPDDTEHIHDLDEDPDRP